MPAFFTNTKQAMGNNSGTYFLDFEIRDSKLYFELKNLSKYASDPERPLYLIKPPGYSNAFTVPALPYGVTDINTLTFGFTNFGDALAQLADGMWEFTYQFCPYDQFCITKKFIRTYNLEKQLGSLVMNYKMCEPEDIKIFQGIQEVDILITAAKAATEEGQFDLAVKFMNEGAQMITKLTKNCLN